MKKLKFEWDLYKDKSNTKKHGVSFSEDKTVFYDQNAIKFFDPEDRDAGVSKYPMTSVVNLGVNLKF